MSFVSLYLYVPDEGSLLPKYRDCTTSNDFESYICIYIYIIQQFSLIYVVFLINVVKLCTPLSKLDLPTLRKGSTEERTQRNK